MFKCFSENIVINYFKTNKTRTDTILSSEIMIMRILENSTSTVSVPREENWLYLGMKKKRILCYHYVFTQPTQSVPRLSPNDCWRYTRHPAYDRWYRYWMSVFTHNYILFGYFHMKQCFALNTDF